ncbi:myb-related transcription factor, partner of profilin-like [Parasteatoda tepidariorum]|uniref:myb-related transcription factor, partner of profilin-like n=1 Tax=Parasteatoda tepidariorum TaxID=114398 RepID=UPI0039BD76FA
METMKEKKALKRTSNFSEFEKNSLIEICTQHPEIEAKDSDNFANMQKRKAWIKIHEQFIGINGGEKTIGNLQGLWKRLKMAGKEEHDRRGLHARKTGGGPALPPIEEKFNKILSVLGDNVSPIRNADDPPSPIVGNVAETFEVDFEENEYEMDSREQLNSTPTLVQEVPQTRNVIFFRSLINADDIENPTVLTTPGPSCAATNIKIHPLHSQKDQDFLRSIQRKPQCPIISPPPVSPLPSVNPPPPAAVTLIPVPTVPLPQGVQQRTLAYAKEERRRAHEFRKQKEQGEKKRTEENKRII